MNIRYRNLGRQLKSKIIKKDTKDLKGITIPKGTRIFILKEFDLEHYSTHELEHFTKCLIDNGTDIKTLMPETVFKEVVKKLSTKLQLYLLNVNVVFLVLLKM